MSFVSYVIVMCYRLIIEGRTQPFKRTLTVCKVADCYDEDSKTAILFTFDPPVQLSNVNELLDGLLLGEIYK